MSDSPRRVRQVLAVLVLLGLGPLGSGGVLAAPALADGSFDGAWSGGAVTSIGGGRCGLNWALTGTISGGEITGRATRGPREYELNGKVYADGTVKWHIYGSDASAAGKGRIDGSTLSGDWYDNNKNDCTGDFKLERGG